jgi:hypothetical protein
MIGRARLRRPLCLLLALAIVALVPALMAGPASASEVGSNNALQELTGGEGSSSSSRTATTATTSTTSSSGGSSSTSRTLILAASGAAVALLLAIGFVIVRDARRVAPAGDVDVVEARAGHDAAVRLRKRRAKAKAARAQRKRNR